MGKVLDKQLSVIDNEDLEARKKRMLVREFHISKAVRDTYDFDEELFAQTGNVILADIKAARSFAHKLNQSRQKEGREQEGIKTSDLYSMGLIDEILHYIAQLYNEEQESQIFKGALEYLQNSLGKGVVDSTLYQFSRLFPPVPVYQNRISIEAYLAREEEGVTGRELALEELLMLWLENANPAFSPFKELFDDGDLSVQAAYQDMVDKCQEFFAAQPPYGPKNQTIVEMLRSPARHHPESLHDQLIYIRENWEPLIGKFLSRILRCLDLIKEEAKAHLLGKGFDEGFGKAGTEVYTYGMDEEVERYSPDKDWMPKVVMLAKSTLVWLDQLSKSYKSHIKRLDQIPDEELDTIASRGFNGLWLIGLWERSKASKKVKQICGNPEAEASAYSLMDYQIAEELGGWESLGNLRHRCMMRGIRLASDMVPNHTGIDSSWVEKHPDWFISSETPPFPGYRFTGENLSNRNHFGVFLEDHYYDRTDASVVFKRVDFESGDTRYIYHGNDGTHMPWNDTAQLNFLNAECREAVVNTILHVAKNFPIIRFDAAMTLAKRHYHRLWFPPPGSGGDIPSRSEHGMTAEEFNNAMPKEFWREVVDRVAAEVPDTLLLAEAFWLMEGYFVRTLGMHRVYNSAFMNMLKLEENLKYRQTVKNTMEFDKEILKRFVNFMNNPDEETAVVQYGKGDKYIGVCTLMLTMPGLPMFGHGQVEGFSEKYGMEYRRSYWSETPDEELIRRHERDIFPLIKKRYLFAEARNFLLFDVYNPDGSVNENVFAYTNQAGSERSMVLYNNAYPRAEGWISMSAAFVEKGDHGDQHLVRRSLAEAFGANNNPKRYMVMREQRSGLWFIRSSAEICEKGLFVNLDGYQNQVFLDIHQVEDNEYSHYGQLAHSLNGAGVLNLGEALRSVELRPLHATLSKVLNTQTVNTLLDWLWEDKKVDRTLLAEMVENYAQFINHGTGYRTFEKEAGLAAEAFSDRLNKAIASSQLVDVKEDELRQATYVSLLMLQPLKALFTQAPKAEKGTAPTSSAAADDSQAQLLAEIAAAVKADGNARMELRSLIGEWMLDRQLLEVLGELEIVVTSPDSWKKLVSLMASWGNWYQVVRQAASSSFEKGQKGRPHPVLPKGAAHRVMKAMLQDPQVSEYLEINSYDGVLWYKEEAYDIFVDWLQIVALTDSPESADSIGLLVGSWKQAAKGSEYKVSRLIEGLEGKTN